MIERLTKRNSNGDVASHVDPQKRHMLFVNRLAAYEDSGLSPEEVQEMARAKAEGRLVEVVRCGKCRHYNTTGCSDGCGWCENMDRGVFDEHYCSRGERREKE